jgi:signal transduction histidine kinase
MDVVNESGVGERALLAHGRIIQQGLPTACVVFACVYAAYALHHATAPMGVRVLVPFTAVTAVAFALLGLRSRRPTFTPATARHFTALGALLVLGNIVAHYVLQPTVLNVTHFALFIVGAAGLLLDVRWVAICVVGALGLWVGISAATRPDLISTPAPVVLFVATMVGLLLRLTHGRTVATALAAETALREARRLETVGRIAGGVAHDFNNLMTVVRLNSRRARRAAEARGDTEACAELDDVIAAADRAARLTQELLAVARRQMLRPQPVDLGAVVDGAAPKLEHLVGDAVVVAVARLPGDATVSADPEVLERVLISLAENARDAMPRGGRLTLELDPDATPPPWPAPDEPGADVEAEGGSARVLRAPSEPGEGGGHGPGRWVRLRVTDTGSGMDPLTLARACEPFFTTKPAGTGLGLASVYGAVRQSGGWLTLRSRVGAGTAVDVFLPAAG